MCTIILLAWCDNSLISFDISQSSQTAIPAVSGREEEERGRREEGDTEGLALEGENEKGLTAVEGYCSHECPTFYMYLILTVFTKMTNAASRVPLNIILFRQVEKTALLLYCS